MSAESPEVTSDETESARVWRNIRRHILQGLARLALYAFVLFCAASAIMTKGG